MVKILLDKNPELVNVKNDDGNTPLHLAAKTTGKSLHIFSGTKISLHIFIYSGLFF